MSWIERFPGLSSLDTAEQQILINQSEILAIAKNTAIFGPTKRPKHLMFLLEGSIRVQQVSEKGREIVLYRIRAGESCVMTSACVLAFESLSATGIAESDIQVAAIPLTVFDELVSQSARFRQFIFTAYSRRIADLFHIIEDVAFQRVDIRLAEKLLDIAQGSTSVHITHQQLSAELGTAREVVSRQLSEFQRRNWVTQSRGVVELTDAESLERLAGI